MSCGCSPDLKLSLPVGTSPIWAISVIDPENAGTAVNISGATFEFYVKTNDADDDGDAIFTLTSADGEITITTAASGYAQIANTTAKSALLTAGRVYAFSLRVTFSTGEYRTIRKGLINAENP